MNDGALLLAGIILLITFVVIFYIAVYWKLYKKAGQPGWAVLIPIYHTIVMLHIIKHSGWEILLLLVPIANILLPIFWTYELAKSYTKSKGTAIAAVFFPWIVFPILAFGKAQYLREK